jgi:hypothetical protein
MSKGLIGSLSDVWRKVNLYLETNNYVAPGPKVVAALKADGWRYEEEALIGLHGGVVLHNIYTPEGGRALPGTPEMDRFDAAQRAAASKVYAPPIPA